MTTMRESWTDERLDDLNGKVDSGFREVKAEIGDLRSETNARFDKVDRRFERLEERWDARFEKVDDRFDKIEDKIEARITDRIDSLNRTLLGFAVAVIFLLLTSKVPLLF